MADPTAPQVDSTLIDLAVNSIHKLMEALVAMGAKVAHIKSVSDAFSDTDATVKNVWQTILDGTGKIEGSVLFKGALTLPFGEAILNTEKAFASFQKSGVESSFQVAQSYKDMSDVIINSTKLISGEMAGKLEKYIQGPLMAFAAGADGARNFENAILKTAAASGNLSGVLKASGSDLSGLDDITSSFTQRLLDTAQATGMSKDQIDLLVPAFMKLPGGFDKIVSTGANKNVDMFTAALQVSNGTMRDTSAVMKELYEAQINFNRTGVGALTVLSDISSTANTMKLPLDIVEGSIKSIAAQFAGLGDNAESAIKIFQRFGPAMQNAGIAPGQIAETIKNVGEGIGKMDLAQKAFLSAQSGGPGGLEGAYKIENMIRQGNVADVAKMAEDALRKQFGGRIVTLEEAGKSQGAASEFTKQVAFLKSGAFGGMAKTDQDAYKLLDVFKKGSGFEDIGKQFGTSQENLSQVMNTNAAVVQRNTDALVIANNVKRADEQMKALIALGTLRDLSQKGLIGNELSEIQATSANAAGRTDVLGGKRVATRDEVIDNLYQKTIQGAKISGDVAVQAFNTGIGAVEKAAAYIGGKTAAGTTQTKQIIANQTVGQESTPRSVYTAPETPRRGITGAVVATREEGARQAQSAQPQAQMAQYNGQPNSINVNIQCPDCHKQHLQTIVINEIAQDHKANTGKALIGMPHRR